MFRPLALVAFILLLFHIQLLFAEESEEWALRPAEGHQQFHYLNIVPGQPVFENSTHEMPSSTTTEAPNATTVTSSSSGGTSGSSSSNEGHGSFSLFGPMNAKALYNIMGDIED